MIIDYQLLQKHMETVFNYFTAIKTEGDGNDLLEVYRFLRTIAETGDTVCVVSMDHKGDENEARSSMDSGGKRTN